MRSATLVLFVLFACTASAGEYAVLSSGFRVHAKSHVIEGDTIKFETDKGRIEFPVSAILSFEIEEFTPPPPPAAAPAAAVAMQQQAQPLDPRQLLAEAATKAGLPVSLVHSIAKAESGFHSNAVSKKGAIGLMQLMPGTAAALNADPFDPKQNADAGARYLRDLLIKYIDDPHQVTKAIAAYNAGPGAVDKYHGIPPYRETVNYVNRVVKQYMKNEATSRQ